MSTNDAEELCLDSYRLSCESIWKILIVSWRIDMVASGSPGARAIGGGMTRTVAILTNDQAYGGRLRRLLQSQSEISTRIIRDEPGLSFRLLYQSDVIVLASTLARQRVLTVLRALRLSPAPPHIVVMVRSKDAIEQILDFVDRGVLAAILEEDRGVDLKPALEQVLRGRQYVSPRLMIPLLRRYRELCAELRRSVRQGLC